MTEGINRKTILIFGANGFIGSSLMFHYESKYRIITRKINDSILYIENAISEADIIIHASGVSRSELESDFFNINFQYSTRLYYSLLKETGKVIIYFSSTHFQRDDMYGISKRFNEYIFSQSELVTRNRVYLIRTPNVFGPRAKPNNLSVVSTFCFNLANGLVSSVIEPNKIIELIYIEDLAKILEAFFSHTNSTGYTIVEPQGIRISIDELYLVIRKVARREIFEIDSDIRERFVKNISLTFNYFSNYGK